MSKRSRLQPEDLSRIEAEQNDLRAEIAESDRLLERSNALLDRAHFRAPTPEPSSN